MNNVVQGNFGVVESAIYNWVGLTVETTHGVGVLVDIENNEAIVEMQWEHEVGMPITDVIRPLVPATK